MKARPFILAIACAGSAGIGFMLARGPLLTDQAVPTEGITGRSDAESNGQTGTRLSRPTTQASSVLTRSPEQLLALKNELRSILSASPALEFDWPVRERTAAVLATMSTAELEGFARELFPEDQGYRVDGDDWRFVMLSEIFRQWGLKDPAGACLGMADSNWGRCGVAFHDWLARDPEAVKAWLAKGGFPPEVEKRVASFKKILLDHEAGQNLAEAASTLGTMEPEMRNKTLVEWSKKMALDPDKRSQLLQYLATLNDPELEAKCHEALIHEMAVKSPWEASQFLENNPDLTEDQKHRFNQQVLAQWAFQKPQEAFARWAELKEEKAPKSLFRAFSDWSLNSPGAEQAIEWTKSLHPGPARETFKTRLITSMASGDRFQQALDLSSTLDDPTERIRQMKLVKRAWEEKFPKWAQEWYDKLPQADKDALEKEIE